LLNVLEMKGWRVLKKGLLKQTHDISTVEQRQELVNWIDAAYGEDSGDAVERYIHGLHDAGVHGLDNWDRLTMLTNGPVRAAAQPAD